MAFTPFLNQTVVLSPTSRADVEYARHQKRVGVYVEMSRDADLMWKERAAFFLACSMLADMQVEAQVVIRPCPNDSGTGMEALLKFQLADLALLPEAVARVTDAISQKLGPVAAEVTQ